MEYNKIAPLLNETLVPNVFGGDEDGFTIAEDLSNVVDLGIKIANLDGDVLKTYLKDFVVGVYDTYVDTRSYKDETYGLFVSEVEYGGCVQRVKAKLAKAYDTDILTLKNIQDEGPDYNDGHYYGQEWDARIYSKDSGFMIPWSLSTTMYKRYFTDGAGVQKLISMIEANIDTTLKVELNTLARGVLRKLILDAYQDNRVVQLITEYNTKYGYTSGDAEFITMENWSASERFKIFCQTLILELRKYITDINTKYNNGEVYTFCPESDSRCILLTEFAAEMDVALGSVYHTEMVKGLGDYRTINYWQSPGKDLIPQLSDNSVHDCIKEITDNTDPEHPVVTSVGSIVGIIFDRYGAFITDKLDRITSDYIAKGDFVSYFRHVVKSYAIDPRNTALVLQLA